MRGLNLVDQSDAHVSVPQFVLIDISISLVNIIEHHYNSEDMLAIKQMSNF